MKTRRQQREVRSPWLDRLPSDWRLTRIDRVATAWTSNVDKHTVEGQPSVRLCNYTDVYKNSAITGDMTFMAASATPDQIERFRLMVGDTLITKDSETADDIGIPAIVEYEAPDLVCGYHLAIVRPEPQSMHQRYLYWTLSSEPTLRQWAVLASGVTRVGIRSTDLSKASIPFPPLVEQGAIADFLDRETAQIDTLISKQQQLIKTLRERRGLAVLHAIPLPDGRSEGFDKLGRRTRIGNGSTPRRDNLDYWDEGTYPWLNSSVVNRWRVTQADQFVTAVALDECHLPAVAPGSVLVGLTGQGRTRGLAALLEIPATISQHIAYITPDLNYWDPQYLVWALTAAYQDLRRLSDENGSTKGGLTCEDLKSHLVSMPDLRAQRSIAKSLDEQTAKIDALIEKAEEFIILAKERRAALITAAVTGQIDISKAA